MRPKNLRTTVNVPYHVTIFLFRAICPAVIRSAVGDITTLEISRMAIDEYEIPSFVSIVSLRKSITSCAREYPVASPIARSAGQISFVRGTEGLLRQQD